MRGGGENRTVSLLTQCKVMSSLPNLLEINAVFFMEKRGIGSCRREPFKLTLRLRLACFVFFINHHHCSAAMTLVTFLNHSVRIPPMRRLLCKCIRTAESVLVAVHRNAGWKFGVPKQQVSFESAPLVLCSISGCYKSPGTSAR